MSGPAGIFVKIVLIVLTFYVLYVIYQFLYSSSTTNDKVSVKGVNLARPATTADSRKTFTVTGETGKDNSRGNAIVNIGDQQDFCVDYWMYISDTQYLPSKHKFILSIGEGSVTGNAVTSPENVAIGNQSLLVYLTAYNYGLAVRTNTIPTNSPATTNPLLGTTITPLFRNAAPIASAGSDLTPCDIPSLDVQKWVHVGIVYSNKTLDIYLDGKLARSCILPVGLNLGSPTNYKLNVLAFGGFGGYVSNITTHDYALNPEQMWRIYMTGPGPVYGLWDSIKSLFDPTAVGSLQYPNYPSPPATT